MTLNTSGHLSEKTKPTKYLALCLSRLLSLKQLNVNINGMVPSSEFLDNFLIHVLNTIKLEKYSVRIGQSSKKLFEISS